jgi:hypothetical protein
VADSVPDAHGVVTLTSAQQHGTPVAHAQVAPRASATPNGAVVCSCRYSQYMGVPCWHILLLRDRQRQQLLHVGMIAPRWLLTNPERAPAPDVADGVAMPLAADQIESSGSASSTVTVAQPPAAAAAALRLTHPALPAAAAGATAAAAAGDVAVEATAAAAAGGSGAAGRDRRFRCGRRASILLSRLTVTLAASTH